jgi:hypothetical protein
VVVVVEAGGVTGSGVGVGCGSEVAVGVGLGVGVGCGSEVAVGVGLGVGVDELGFLKPFISFCRYAKPIKTVTSIITVMASTNRLEAFMVTSAILRVVLII